MHLCLRRPIPTNFSFSGRTSNITAMKRAAPLGEHVDILSSDSDADDYKTESKELNNGISIDQFMKELVSEEVLIRKARMYQEYMQAIPIPTQRATFIPCTSWVDLAASIKQLYGQPLHYLTNVQMKQWDQMRFGTDDEDVPLQTIIHPVKAEVTIWLIEEVNRGTSSYQNLAKLWLADPTYRTGIDPIFPKLQNSSK